MRMHRLCKRIYSSDVRVKNTQICVVVRYAFGEGPLIWVKSANILTKKYFKNLTSYSSFSGMILYYKRSQFFIVTLRSNVSLLYQFTRPSLNSSRTIPDIC